MTMVIWPHRVSPLGAALIDQKAGETPALCSAGVPPAVGCTGRVKRIVMAGGGTGGHLYPGLAVAEALEQACAASGGVELIWAATPRTVDKHLLSGFGPRYVPQPVQPLVKKLSKLWAFWQGWRKSCAYWKSYFRDHKVDAEIGRAHV